MPKPTLTSTSYEFTRAQIDQLILAEVRAQLHIPDNKSVTLSYDIREVGGDPMDRFPGHPDVIGIKINIQ